MTIIFHKYYVQTFNIIHTEASACDWLRSCPLILFLNFLQPVR